MLDSEEMVWSIVSEFKLWIQIPVLLLVSSVTLDEFCNLSVPVNIKYNSKYVSENRGEGSVSSYMLSS